MTQWGPSRVNGNQSPSCGRLGKHRGFAAKHDFLGNHGVWPLLSCTHLTDSLNHRFPGMGLCDGEERKRYQSFSLDKDILVGRGQSLEREECEMTPLLIGLQTGSAECHELLLGKHGTGTRERGKTQRVWEIFCSQHGLLYLDVFRPGD